MKQIENIKSGKNFAAVSVGKLDEIIERAIITYCKIHFSALSDGEWSRLKASYDEQKAQLNTATGYTDWLGVG